MEPDDIERREFVTTFRGYDRNEVDAFLKEVGQEIRRLNKELAKVQAKVEKAEIQKHAQPPRPAKSPGDKAEAYRQVGEETAKVLMAAETAANEIRESGRHQATEIVADARRKAQQLVKEAGEGRKDIEDDIKRLKDTRSVLATQLEDVKKRLSEAVARLQAPDDAPTGVKPAPRVAPRPGSSRPARPEPAPRPGAEQARPEPARPKPEPTRQEPSARPKPEPKQPEPASQAEPAASVEAPAPAGPGRQAQPAGTASELEPAPPTAGRPGPLPPPVEQPIAGREPAETVEVEPVKPDPTRINGSRPADDEAAVSEPAGPPAPIRPPAPAPEAHPGDPVEQLLAEIRQESPAPPDLDAAEAPPAAAPAAPEPPEPSDAGNEVFDRRMGAVGGIPVEAARRLKRLLQEDQNELLHRIRTQRGKGSLSDNVPDPADQKARFNQSLQQVLGRAFAEGRKAAGASGPGNPEGPVGNLIARQVVKPLRAEVEKVVEAGLSAGDTASAIAERASDVIRVWKGVRTDLLGQAMVYAAFHQGLLDAWGSKKTAKKKWAISVEERHCPGDICRKNAAQGALGLSSTFASGHLAPPAHGGCTCTIEAS